MSLSQITPLQLSMDYDFKRFSAIQKEFKLIDKEGKGFLSLREIVDYVETTKLMEISEELKRELMTVMDVGHLDTPIAM